jgi:hypothetical protein
MKCDPVDGVLASVIELDDRMRLGDRAGLNEATKECRSWDRGGMIRARVRRKILS